MTQPGAVCLEFLRVRLLCIEQRVTWHKRNSRDPDGQLQSFSKTTETTLHERTLIEAAYLHVLRSDTWHEAVAFTIPSGKKPSKDSDSRSIVWRLELSGKGGVLTKFVHPFDIEVSN